MNCKRRFFYFLRAMDFWMYRSIQGLFYPLNFLLAVFFCRKKTSGVLHISTVTHQPYVMTRHLRAQGFPADFLAKGTGWLSFDQQGWDFRMGRSRLPGPFRFLYEFWWAWKLYPRYHIIHSHFLQLIGDNFWEITFLKRMGKKIIFHFRGDDVRRKERNMQVNPELNCCQECDYPEEYCHDPRKDLLCDLAKRHGNLFLVTTPDLCDFFPEAIHFPFMMPELPGERLFPVETSEQPGTPFKVLHVTNHRGIDGTKCIVLAVSRLKKEGYPIELLLPQHVPFQELLSMYPGVNLSVGKLRMGYYANAQIEAMCFGVPTMCYIREKYWEGIPDCPIINVRPENLHIRLKYYLDHRDELEAIGRKGPEFVRNHHSGHLLAKRLIELYRNC
jgi:hypothetical protein